MPRHFCCPGPAATHLLQFGALGSPAVPSSIRPLTVVKLDMIVRMGVDRDSFVPVGSARSSTFPRAPCHVLHNFRETQKSGAGSACFDWKTPENPTKMLTGAQLTTSGCSAVPPLWMKCCFPRSRLWPLVLAT